MLNIANEEYPMFSHLLLLFLMYVNDNNNHYHLMLVVLMKVHEVHVLYYLIFATDHNLFH
jgi:hypothetical protein